MNTESRLLHSIVSERLVGVFKNFPLFAGVPEEVLMVFYVASQEKIFRAGQIVVREGDHGEDLYIIGGGSVEVWTGYGSEHPTKLAVLPKNAFFGEMCIIEPTPRSATVVAAETTFVYTLASSALNKVYQLWPRQQAVIMNNLSRELSRRVIALDPAYRDRAY